MWYHIVALPLPRGMLLYLPADHRKTKTPGVCLAFSVYEDEATRRVYYAACGLFILPLPLLDLCFCSHHLSHRAIPGQICLVAHFQQPPVEVLDRNALLRGQVV